MLVDTKVSTNEYDQFIEKIPISIRWTMPKEKYFAFSHLETKILKYILKECNNFIAELHANPPMNPSSYKFITSSYYYGHITMINNILLLRS